MADSVDRIRVPVFSKLSNSPEKGWNIAVSSSTSVQDIIDIVCRALKYDSNLACLYASTPGRTEILLNSQDLILNTHSCWTKEGTQGRFIVRDKEQSGGAELFNLINARVPISTPNSDPPKQRSINTTNTFHMGSKLSTLREGRTSNSSADLRLKNQSENITDQQRKDLQDKKQKLLNLISEYSKKLATPLEPETAAHYQENIRKANLGISHIDQKLRQLVVAQTKEETISKRRSGTPKATNMGTLRNTRPSAATALEEGIIIPDTLRSQFSSGERNLNFSILLTILQSKKPSVQEQALQVIGSLCTIPENQTLLFQTHLLPLILSIIETPQTETKIVKLACWIISMLSSHEPNKERIESAGGIPILIRLLSSSSKEVIEQAATSLTNVLNSRNYQLHKSFKAAGGVSVAIELLNSPSSTINEKVNLLRMIILLGLAGEEKLQLARQDTIESIMQLILEESDPTAQKLAIMVTSSLSSIPQTRSFIHNAPGFQAMLQRLSNEKTDSRVIEKIVVLINNLALSEESITDAIHLLIPFMNHSDVRVKSKTIHCLSNLVLIDEDHLEMFYESEESLPTIISVITESNESIITPAVRVLVNISRDSSLAGSIRSDLGEQGVVKLLTSLLRNNFSSTEIHEQSLKALVNISLTYLNETEYLSSQLISFLLKFFSSSNTQLVECSIATLVNITRTSDKCRESVRLSHPDSLATVISLCNASHFNIQIYACKAITNLALNGRARYFFQQSNGCTSLLEDLSRYDVFALAESASAALRNVLFPCEDYSEDAVNLTSSAQMENLIKETAIQFEELQREETAPVSRDNALLKVLSISTPRSDASNKDDFLDDFFTEFSGSKTIQNPQLALEETHTVHTPRTRETLFLREQRKALEEERKKLEEERRKFEEERNRLSNTNESAPVKIEEIEAQHPAVEREEHEEVDVVDPVKEEKYHTRRMKIAVEMLVTERSYVDSLNTMVNKYMNPLHGLALARRPVIKNNQVDEIFANIEEIINYHTMLLEGLERRVSKFDKATCLGEFFISMIDYLRCYPTYVNNYNNAIAILTELEENSDFEAKLKNLTDNGITGKSIYTYLIMPIQRVPRYILLLNELIKHTKESHPDYPHLIKAVEKMEQLADYIDESKEVYNENHFIVSLQKRMHGFPKEQTLVAPNRVLIKNAALIMNQSDYWVFLFTDILIQTELITSQTKEKKKKKKEELPHYQFVRLIRLEGVELFDYPNSKVAPNAFSLRGKDYSFNCSTNTPEEKVYWLCAFKESVVTV